MLLNILTVLKLLFKCFLQLVHLNHDPNMADALHLNNSLLMYRFLSLCPLKVTFMYGRNYRIEFPLIWILLLAFCDVVSYITSSSNFPVNWKLDVEVQYMS